jgi:prepilin peptidase CpaA
MLIIKTYLIFSMLAIIWFDARHYIIPNWLVASLLGLYPVMLFMGSGAIDWPMALAGMAIVFAAGYAIFAKKWMGAGDIKLITVCSLWVGWENLLEYIFLFAIMGGLLSVALWGGRKLLIATRKFSQAKLPRVLREGEPVPYGIVISIAFLIFLAEGKIPGLAL